MNIAELDLYNIARFGEYTKLHSNGRSYTNIQLRRRAGSLARVLQRHDVAPGDRVLVMTGNVHDAVVALQAAWIAGAVATPIPPELSAGDLEDLIEELGAHCCVTSLEFARILRDAFLARPGPRHLLVFGPTEFPEAENVQIQIEKILPLETMVDREPDDAAMLLYAPDGADRPKTIVVTHGALFVSAAAQVRANDVTQETLLHTLPLSNPYGVLMIKLATVGQIAHNDELATRVAKAAGACS